MAKKKSAAAVTSSVRIIERLQSKKSNKKRKGKGKGNRRGGSAMVPLQAAIGAAPRSTRPLTYVKFSTAPPLNGATGLRMECCLPALKIGVKGNAVSGDGALFNIGSTTVPTQTQALDPSLSGIWYHPGVPLMTGCFDRFKLRKATAHYRQIAGVTSAAAPFIFAYSADARHPNITTPTEGSFLGLQTNREFNAWEDWDLVLPIPETNLLYSYDLTTDAADYRLQDAGAFGCLCQFASTPAVTYGNLYITWIVDLYDFSPIYKTVSYHADNPRRPKGSVRVVDEDEKSFIGVTPSSLNSGQGFRRPIR
jgi:hypothetical protein